MDGYMNGLGESGSMFNKGVGNYTFFFKILNVMTTRSNISFIHVLQENI